MALSFQVQNTPTFEELPSLLLPAPTTSYQNKHYSSSVPSTPCDSEPPLWPEKPMFFEGLWWWQRPLDVRRNCCRRCGASSSTRPLKMMPCAGVTNDEWERRPLMSRDRPLLFSK